MAHYICTGECKGVSDTAKNCGDPACSKHNQPLQPCDCKDGRHEKKQEKESK